MRTLRWLFIFSLVFCAGPVRAQELSAQDKQFLDKLISDFVYDPRGAQRIELSVKVRSVWASSSPVVMQGWLSKHKDGERIYFTDGASMPAPGAPKLAPIDFVAECKQRYDNAAKDAKNPFAQMRLNAIGLAVDSDLVNAAWLYRLGEKKLAAKALARIESNERAKAVAELRRGLAWTAFAGMVHAYMVRADEEALEHGERLLRLYADEARQHPQAESLVRELKRRQTDGSFGMGEAKALPGAFAQWDATKQLTFLIESLQDVDARQQSQPGGVNLAEDFRVAALIKIGDPAVPALIDVLEKDERLTRSVHCWRDFAPSRTVLSVREAALTALMSILRIRFFAPSATGDNFTARGEAAAKETAAKLRAYWKEFGALAFDERMMKVLTDPKSRFEAMREAADNLAHLGDERTLGTTVWSNTLKPRPKTPNPAIQKFKQPTAAEAILMALDRDLEHHDAQPKDFLHDFQRRRLEDSYLFPLIDLGDQRMAAILAKRAAHTDSMRMRRKWAFASYHLGEPLPLQKYADDFAAGKIMLPANDRPQLNDFDQPGHVELLGIVRFLSGVAIPEADRALHALADPKHPGHEVAARAILAGNHRFEEKVWTQHPYCLPILAAALSDDKLRDKAGKQLAQLTLGLPLPTRDSVKEIQSLITLFQHQFRRATTAELKALAVIAGEPLFLPGIVPLDRAATAADAKAGRAIFHRNGQGKRADMVLPAYGVWRIDGDLRYPRRVLIVQAETGLDGKMTYGIIGWNATLAVPGEHVSDIAPLRESKTAKE